MWKPDEKTINQTILGLKVIITVVVLGALTALIDHFRINTTGLPLKEYKDGIQNHLTWNIKGECFFVRPNDDVTVYLIRVNDCDKK